MFPTTPTKLKKSFLIYSFLLFSIIGHSQNDANQILDSLIRNIELCKKSGKGLANAYLQLGNQNIMFEKYSDAIPILENAHATGKATGDTITWVRSFGSLGWAYNMRGESQKGFEYYLEGMNAADSLKMEKLQARYLFYLGSYFGLQRQFEPALEYLNKSGALYKKLEMKGGYCRSYLLTLANVYNQIGTKEGNQKALDIRHQLLSAECEEALNEGERARVYNGIGEIYIVQKKYKLAEDYILKALKQFRKENMPSTLVHALHNLADLNSAKGDYEKAKVYIDEAYEIAQEGEDIFALFNAAEASGEINNSLGYYKKAIKDLKLSSSLRDSVEEIKRVEVIADLELKYKTEQKEEAIAKQELQLKNQELALVLQQNRFQSLLGWASFILALLGGFFFWSRNRLKLKEKESKNLEALNRQKTRYFTNISHELRTPLSLIIDPLNQLKENLNNQSQKKLVNTASGNAERMLELVNQMLDLNKLEAGKLPLKAQKRDLRLSLSAIVNSFQNFSEQRNINLNFISEVKSLETYIDPDKFEKIISNLLSNAFKFTNEGDRVLVKLLKNNQQAEIHIKDNGIGIPADKLSFIFDRFYQVDDSETRKVQGTGIGLSLAKELVELHHGKITAKSTEGSETIITIKLPLGKTHLQPSDILPAKTLAEYQQRKDCQDTHRNKEATVVNSLKQVQKNGKEPPILLIIEDHQELRKYIIEQFQSEYQILEAADGTEGLAIAKEDIPDLIISDIMMPGIDGLDLCYQIKSNEHTSHIPIILLTAKSDPIDKIHGLKMQADDYLTKPFDSEILRARVENLIEQRNQLRSKFSHSNTVHPKDIAVNSLDEAFLENLLNIIEENMSNEKFGVEEMSKAIALSRSQLHRKLKALTGQSSSAFLRIIRLKRAYQLLEKSAGNASEIAYQVGFSNSNYFFKCFKEEYGITPGQVIKGEKVG